VRSILNKAGIPVKVNLPAVGENLQDQPNSQIIMTSNTTFNGSIPYVAFGSASDILDSLPKNVNLTAWAEKVAVAIDHAISVSSLEQIFRIQYKLISNGVVDAESILQTSYNIGYGPSGLVASAFWLLLPFSRGNVHISSSDPLAYPVLNPNFFLVDFDVDVQVAIAKWTRKFWDTAPIQGLATETTPGFDVLPKDASDEQWANWVKTTC
jgi:choline dehydrogenase-like flavoprotein